MEIAYVLIAVAALVALYFVFGRKAEPKQLARPPGEKKLPSKRPPKSEAPDESVEAVPPLQNVPGFDRQWPFAIVSDTWPRSCCQPPIGRLAA